ncbi:hypothetical protein [Lysobacter enzymogenes]|uniref:hypothetical protein n=1 Tax=Lysobacter enzymogenes TaxID=69 RepID=UPI001A96B437|nr:hypothetical protein [Lysobacter enzymogenes]QQP96057.1 hypothetical protein JHW38_23060 [Lysobacter enzymogenes]
MSHAIATVSPRARRGAGFLSVLRAFALTAALLFSAAAPADPVRAEQIMQSIRTDRALLDSHMMYVNMYLDAGNIQAAQFSLSMAYSKSIQLSVGLSNLQNELRDSRAAGQYNDAQALDRAIAFSDSAGRDMQMIKAYLMTLQMERPPSQFTRLLLKMEFQKFEIAMRDLQQAMSEA